jgi:hypothetical protein
MPDIHVGGVASLVLSLETTTQLGSASSGVAGPKPGRTHKILDFSPLQGSSKLVFARWFRLAHIEIIWDIISYPKMWYHSIRKMMSLIQDHDIIYDNDITSDFTWYWLWYYRPMISEVIDIIASEIWCHKFKTMISYMISQMISHDISYDIIDLWYQKALASYSVFVWYHKA